MTARGWMSAPGWIVGFALVAIAWTPARGAVGDLDLSFGGTGIVIAPVTPTPALASAVDVLIDDQDRILLVGFTYVPGGADVALLRILPDGTPDPSFGTNGRVVTSLSPGADFVAAARFDAQGRVIVASYSSAAQGGTDLAVARFLPSGVLDPTFSDDGWNSAPLGTEQEFAGDLAIDADGRIVIVGTTIEGDGYSDILLARFTDDGRLDETFGNAGLVRTDVGGGADGAGGVVIDASGRIVLAGYACGSSCSMAVLRYRADGTLDPTFGGGGVVFSNPGTVSSGASAVVLDALGRITVSGSAQSLSGQSLVAARYLDDGSPDPSFSGDGITSWSVGTDTSGIELAIDDAGRVLVTGSAGRFQFDRSLVLTRFLADGRLDTSFDDDGWIVTAIPGVDALATAVAVDRSGRVLVVGEGEVAQGDRRFVVARHQATSATEPGDVLVLDDTTTDTGIVLRVSPSTGAFSILADRELLWDSRDIAVTRDGRILVATFGSVVEIDATSGAQRWVASGDDIRSPVALAAEDAGSFVVLDASAKVVRITTSTGVQTLLSSGGLLVEPRDVAIAADGAILVLDGASGGGIVRVERADGAQSVIASGGELATARSLVAQPDGTALVLAGGVGEPAAAVRVDLATGQQTPVALPGAVLDPAGAALDASGRLLVADARQVVRWSTDGAVNVWTSPALVGPVAVAAYGGPRCGDGIVGEGEACDAGPSGGGCCSSSCRILVAGALCRPRSTICDTSERCDGVSPECPADATSPDGDGDGVCDHIDHCPLDADPAQQDSDHDGRGDACDPCTGGSAIARPRLRLLNDATPQADDTFSMSGTVSLAPGTVVDPIANGLRLYVEDGLAMAVLDLTVPPGPASTSSGSGWRSNRARTAFTYRRRTGSDRLTARLTTAGAHPGQVKLSLSGKGSFVPNLLDGVPAKVALVLDPPVAASGACGEASVYDGTLACAVGRPSGTLVCR